MLAQNASMETVSATRLDAQDAKRHEASADRESIALDGYPKTGCAVEGRDEPQRLSPRMSIAIIAGLSAGLWLTVALLVF